MIGFARLRRGLRVAEGDQGRTRRHEQRALRDRHARQVRAPDRAHCGKRRAPDLGAGVEVDGEEVAELRGDVGVAPRDDGRDVDVAVRRERPDRLVAVQVPRCELAVADEQAEVVGERRRLVVREVARDCPGLCVVNVAFVRARVVVAVRVDRARSSQIARAPATARPAPRQRQRRAIKGSRAVAVRGDVDPRRVHRRQRAAHPRHREVVRELRPGRPVEHHPVGREDASAARHGRNFLGEELSEQRAPGRRIRGQHEPVFVGDIDAAAVVGERPAVVAVRARPQRRAVAHVQRVEDVVARQHERPPACDHRI